MPWRRFGKTRGLNKFHLFVVKYSANFRTLCMQSSNTRHGKYAMLTQELGGEHGSDPDDAVGRKSILFGVAGYILITEFCERLAYYGFAGSLVLFFQV